jgi:hypothetical protein
MFRRGDNINTGNNPKRLFWVRVAVKVDPVVRKKKKIEEQHQDRSCLLRRGDHRNEGHDLEKCVLGSSSIVMVDNTVKSNFLRFRDFLSVMFSDRSMSPTTRHEGPWGERRYSSYSLSTSALDGGEWSALRLGCALAPRKGTPVPIVQETGWALEPVWTKRLEEKSFTPAVDRTPIARSSSP